MVKIKIKFRNYEQNKLWKHISCIPYKFVNIELKEYEKLGQWIFKLWTQVGNEK